VRDVILGELSKRDTITVSYSICITYKQEHIAFKQPVENQIRACEKYWDRIQNGDILIQLLSSWTLTIAMFLFKITIKRLDSVSVLRHEAY
jgi:hypothetical protein